MPFALMGFHDALDAEGTEVVRAGFHDLTINTYDFRLPADDVEGDELDCAVPAAWHWIDRHNRYRRWQFSFKDFG